LLAGLALAAVVARFLFLARHRDPVARRVAEADRDAFASLAAAAAAWGIARRAAGCGFDSALLPLCLAAVVAAVPYLFLPLVPGVRFRA
jgi:hypothetical protein